MKSLFRSLLVTCFVIAGCVVEAEPTAPDDPSVATTSEALDVNLALGKSCRYLLTGQGPCSFATDGLDGVVQSLKPGEIVGTFAAPRNQDGLEIDLGDFFEVRSVEVVRPDFGLIYAPVETITSDRGAYVDVLAVPSNVPNTMGIMASARLTDSAAVWATDGRASVTFTNGTVGRYIRIRNGNPAASLLLGEVRVRGVRATAPAIVQPLPDGGMPEPSPSADAGEPITPTPPDTRTVPPIAPTCAAGTTYVPSTGTCVSITCPNSVYAPVPVGATAVRYVNATQPAQPLGVLGSETYPFASLAAALSVTPPRGAVILLARGTYVSDLASLPSDVTILGACRESRIVQRWPLRGAVGTKLANLTVELSFSSLTGPLVLEDVSLTGSNAQVRGVTGTRVTLDAITPPSSNAILEADTTSPLTLRDLTATANVTGPIVRARTGGTVTVEGCVLRGQGPLVVKEGGSLTLRRCELAPSSGSVAVRLGSHVTPQYAPPSLFDAVRVTLPERGVAFEMDMDRLDLSHAIVTGRGVGLTSGWNGLVNASDVNVSSLVPSAPVAGMVDPRSAQALPALVASYQGVITLARVSLAGARQTGVRLTGGTYGSAASLTDTRIRNSTSFLTTVDGSVVGIRADQGTQIDLRRVVLDSFETAGIRAEGGSYTQATDVAILNTRGAPATRTFGQAIALVAGAYPTPTVNGLRVFILGFREAAVCSAAGGAVFLDSAFRNDVSKPTGQRDIGIYASTNDSIVRFVRSEISYAYVGTQHVRGGGVEVNGGALHHASYAAHDKTDTVGWLSETAVTYLWNARMSTPSALPELATAP